MVSNTPPSPLDDAANFIRGEIIAGISTSRGLVWKEYA